MPGERLAYVTGATGFVGLHLVERLVKDGFRVRALVLDGDDASALRSLGVECVNGNVSDAPEQLRKGMQGATHVFHCAAWVDDWAPREKMAEVNVNGVRNMLEAAGPLKPERFVLLGSFTVYGDRDQVGIDESAPFLKTGDSYNFTKVECERVLWDFVRKTGLRAVVLRPSYVYGPRDQRLFPSLCRTITKGQWVYLNGGEVPITLVSVANVVEMCVLAATREEAVGQAFIVADDESVTRRELVEIVCDEMGYKRPKMSLPRGVGKLLCPFADGLAWMLAFKRPYLINRFLYHFAGVHLTYDLSKAKRLLGYHPKPGVKEQLRETVRWFKKNRPELLKRA